MKKHTIKFTIRQDGTVIEEVIGVTGKECLKMTKDIEEKLGEVIQLKPKPEYYQTKENITPQYDQNEVNE